MKQLPTVERLSASWKVVTIGSRVAEAKGPAAPVKLSDSGLHLQAACGPSAGRHLSVRKGLLHSAELDDALAEQLLGSNRLDVPLRPPLPFLWRQGQSRMPRRARKRQLAGQAERSAT